MKMLKNGLSSKDVTKDLYFSLLILGYFVTLIRGNSIGFQQQISVVGVNKLYCYFLYV